jgi:predicted DNA-binding protein (MmcQ/YjbR family)
MDIKEILTYCLNKPGAFEDYPFGPDPIVLKVGSKMFALLSIKEGKGAISLKCDPFIAEALRQQYDAVKPGYHLNKQHWNTVTLDGTVPDREVLWMVDCSWGLVRKVRL